MHACGFIARSSTPPGVARWRMYNGSAVHADLERVIALQRLDTAAEAARRKLADEPEHEKALDARLEAAKQRVATAKARLAENQNTRRAIEKELAVHQGRLSKFREQAMAVKTNQEYHAIQKEIGFAQNEIKTLEDRVLERMIEADEISLPSPVCRELARIVQEALVNVRKHSGAKQVTVQLVEADGKWELTIEDDGAGFPFAGKISQAELDSSGRVPAIIRERVRLIQGELTIESKPGSGARLEILVPQAELVS